MIFSTINQANCFLCFIFFGIICALISKIFFVLFLKNFKKLPIKLLFECIFYTISALFFDFLLVYLNFGRFSISLLLAFVGGCLWFNLISKNLVVFFETKWYTLVNKMIQQRKMKHANKSKKS